MANPVRKTNSKHPTTNSDHTVDLEVFFDEPPPPKDPAQIATKLLILNAVAAAQTTLEIAGRDGAVTLLVVPSPDWLRLVGEEWEALADNRKSDATNGAQPRWSRRCPASWTYVEDSRSSYREDANASFAQALAMGRHCAAVVSDQSKLPQDILHAADHRIELKLLTSVDVQSVARDLCGDDATEMLTDAEALALSPKLLRLGRRVGQSADDYVRKLRDLLEQQPVSDALAAPVASSLNVSPRDQPMLERLHGMDAAVAWGKNVARDLENYKDGKLAWSEVDRGCLISGPPGCGKTLFAQALATSCNISLVTGSYGEWHGAGTGHQGDFLKALKTAFTKARNAAPAILFIDEVDSFPNRSKLTHSHADYMIQVVNALLAEIDGVAGREGVILVGACNHPEKLDPALVRSGRFDRHIRIGLPDRTALAAIFREHLGSDLAEQDLTGAALAATGASGADCERLVRGARRRARTAARPMALKDLLDEIGGDDGRSKNDLLITAIHEAGHVVVSSLLRPGSVGMVSIRQTTVQGGATEISLAYPLFVRLTDIRRRLLVLLGGRAAEEEFFGAPSSGAGGRAESDIGMATELAVTSSVAWGLDVAGGLVWRGEPTPQEVPGTLAADPVLAARVQALLEDVYGEARDMLRPAMAAVKAVADALIEKRVLDGPEAEAIVHKHLALRPIKKTSTSC